MWTTRYDNEDTWEAMRAQALAEGYTHTYWGSDDCWGFEGAYNGGTCVFYTDPNELPDGLRQDALRHGKPLRQSS